MLENVFFLIESWKEFIVTFNIFNSIEQSKRNERGKFGLFLSSTIPTLNFVSRKDWIDLRPVSPTINYTPQSEIGHREAAYSTKRRKLRNTFPISITMLVEGRSDFSAWSDIADYFLRESNSEQKKISLLKYLN